MIRRLPPLNQLRAFEAAARHLSFKRAAEELNVTHAAVSHQIRALEDTLGSQLFQRVTRGVRLTDKARELAADLERAFDRMDGAVRRFRAEDLTGILRISVLPWYGNRLLLPNLPDFHAAHAGLQIDLDFSYETVDLESGDFDAALRHGLGGWTGLSHIQVHHDLVTPLCAPDLIAGEDLPLSPQRISEMKLATARGFEDSWRLWLAEAGCADCRPEFVEFENRALATEYALAGHGACLPDLRVMRLELESGQLVRLHPLDLTLASGIHLAYPQTPHADPRLRLFAE